MTTALLIARRELGGYFRSMTGYIIAGLVLLVEGVLFNAFVLSAGEMYSAEVLANFFYISFGTTVIASVFISMRLVAEERQTGTLVLLTSSPVHDWEIVARQVSCRRWPSWPSSPSRRSTSPASCS